MGLDQVLESVENGIKYIDLQFTDVPGRLQHVTIPAKFLDEDSFSSGVPKLDGSSIRGFVDIHESDLVLYPDPSTYAIIPWILSRATAPPDNPIVRCIHAYAHIGIVRDSSVLNHLVGLLIKSARNDRYSWRYLLLTPLKLDRNDLRNECLFSHPVLSILPNLRGTAVDAFETSLEPDSPR
ncbi:Glutamine synthetase 1 [Candidatus Calditenuaceae archaeon HR02]|nr:Glutamine synthetase 1 [Candidatus Calditenuaceae archaeon HR02]